MTTPIDSFQSRLFTRFLDVNLSVFIPVGEREGRTGRTLSFLAFFSSRRARLSFLARRSSSVACPSLLLELLPVVESRSRDCRSSLLCRWRRSREVSESWVEEVEGERLALRREGGGERERERYRRTGERERERSRSTLPRDIFSSRVVTTSSRDLLKLDISSRIEREEFCLLYV